MGETVIWDIHGGKTGAADTLFLSKGYIAVGWAEAGDLSRVDDREISAWRCSTRRRKRRSRWSTTAPDLLGVVAEPGVEIGTARQALRGSDAVHDRVEPGASWSAE